MDGADGQLARLTGKTSELGKAMDGLVDHLSFALVYIGLTLPAADVFRTGGTLAEAAAAARKGADSTASLAATHGRSAYLAEETQRGVVDPGARAVAIAFAAVASA